MLLNLLVVFLCCIFGCLLAHSKSLSYAFIGEYGGKSFVHIPYNRVFNTLFAQPVYCQDRDCSMLLNFQSFLGQQYHSSSWPLSTRCHWNFGFDVLMSYLSNKKWYYCPCNVYLCTSGREIMALTWQNGLLPNIYVYNSKV